MYPLNASHPAVKKNTAATSTVSNVIQACYSSKQGYNTQKPILTFCLQDKAPFINTSSVQIGSNTAADHVGQNSSAHVARSSRSDLDATHLKWNGLFLKRPIRLPSPHLVGILLGWTLNDVSLACFSVLLRAFNNAKMRKICKINELKRREQPLDWETWESNWKFYP